MRDARIVGSKNGRFITIGENIRTYREAANLPESIFAERCGITLDGLRAIESGLDRNLNTKTCLKISEELHVGYSDLFETSDGRYQRNFEDRYATEVIRRKKHELKINNKFLSGKAGTTVRALCKNITRGVIPNPFIFQNLLTLLKITSRDLTLDVPDAKPKIERQEPQRDILGDVIKACEFYKKAEEISMRLDEIIRTATELKKAIESAR